MNACVYMLEFPNGKRYIGQTIQGLKKRIGKNGSGYKTGIIKKAIEEFGFENVKCFYWEVPKQEMLDPLERFLINHFDTTNPEKGYNTQSGGKSGFSHSADTIKKMSDTHIGIPMREETKEKLREIHTGMKHTKETIDKMSGVNHHCYGKPARNRKPVIIDGVEYGGITIAAEALGHSYSTIYTMLKDGRASFA